MKHFFLLILFCATVTSLLAQKKYNFQTKFQDAIPVLNIGTFHMRDTPDANKIEFDAKSKENISQIQMIAKQIATFKPTIILVELPPSMNLQLSKSYNDYIEKSIIDTNNTSEIELLAFEVGKLSNTRKIYGIDYKQEYFYQINNVLKSPQDSSVFKKYGQLIRKNIIDNNINPEVMGVKEMLYMINHPKYLDNLINENADLLTTVSVNK